MQLSGTSFSKAAGVQKCQMPVSARKWITKKKFKNIDESHSLNYKMFKDFYLFIHLFAKVVQVKCRNLMFL